MVFVYLLHTGDWPGTTHSETNDCEHCRQRSHIAFCTCRMYGGKECTFLSYIEIIN